MEEEYKEETDKEELANIQRCVEYSADQRKEGATRPEVGFAIHDIFNQPKRRAG